MWATTLASPPGRSPRGRPGSASTARRAAPPSRRCAVRVLEDGRPVQRDLERFLAASDTTAFLILRGDTLLYEGYFNGYDHNSTQTSMSIAKSVLGALVGIAIAEGRIGSVTDPITRYVPELLRRDRRFARITLRHLLTMRSGLRYQEGGTPWSDDTATYYAPDLRAAALRNTEIVEQPGRRFHYNNYNPLLVGLALERATGMPVATYLERKLWQPLGMEADGSWRPGRGAIAIIGPEASMSRRSGQPLADRGNDSGDDQPRRARWTPLAHSRGRRRLASSWAGTIRGHCGSLYRLAAEATRGVRTALTCSRVAERQPHP
jgi:CubicO group peptidase (beta-lactamase class C family)